eukprot:1267390-Heterocapsa_arctica.AAC.1
MIIAGQDPAAQAAQAAWLPVYQSAWLPGCLAAWRPGWLAARPGGGPGHGILSYCDYYYYY